MKMKYLSFEFLFIFLFLILPPLLIPPSPAPLKAPQPNWGNAQALAVAVLLCIQLDRLLCKKKSPPIRAVSTATVSFGSLMLIYAAVELGTLALAQLLHSGEPAAAPRTVGGAWDWLLAITALAAGAFSEECLYRVFLPEVPLRLLARWQGGFSRRHGKVLRVMVEALCVLIFAFSHRYLGSAAVANALLCGIVLRRCYQKSGRILCGTAAHFCYNLTLLAFSSFSGS